MKRLDKIDTSFILVMSAILLLFFYSVRPKSYRRMEAIANSRFEYKLLNPKLKFGKSDFKMFSTKDADSNGITFSWYHILDWNDSAIINIHVTRRGRFLRDPQLRVTMNAQWSYLFEPVSKFINILPDEHKGDSTYLSLFSPELVIFGQPDNTDSVKMVIQTDRMLNFLKNGYFEIRRREKSSTIVSFYEAIAIIYQGGISREVSTMLIYFTEGGELVFIPLAASKAILDNSIS